MLTDPSCTPEGVKRVTPTSRIFYLTIVVRCNSFAIEQVPAGYCLNSRESASYVHSMRPIAVGQKNWIHLGNSIAAISLVVDAYL